MTRIGDVFIFSIASLDSCGLVSNSGSQCLAHRVLELADRRSHCLNLAGIKTSMDSARQQPKPLLRERNIAVTRYESCQTGLNSALAPNLKGGRGHTHPIKPFNVGTKTSGPTANSKGQNFRMQIFARRRLQSSMPAVCSETVKKQSRQDQGCVQNRWYCRGSAVQNLQKSTLSLIVGRWRDHGRKRKIAGY